MKKRTQIRLWIGVGLLAVIVIVYGGASLIAYNRLSLGTRHFDSSTPAVPFEDVIFPARNATYLVHAFYLLGKADRPAIIDVHGYNESRHVDYYLKRTASLQSLGYTVLSVDLSDNGGDTYQNGRISMGVSERWDVLGAFDYLLSRGFAATKIGVLGESMGAATALLAAGLEPRIRAVWADSSYADVSVVLSEQSLSEGYPPILIEGGMAWGVVMSGEHVWESRPVEMAPLLAQHQQAVYLVASRGDKFVYFHHGTDLYTAFQAARVRVTFWDVQDPAVGHGQTITLQHEEYMRRVDAFFSTGLS